MRSFIKLAAAAALIGVLAGVVTDENAVGRIVRSTLADVAGFCERQPGACEETVGLAREFKDLLRSEVHRLTAEDLALEPPADPQHSLAGHNPVE